MYFDWDRPITYESVLAHFADCKDLNEVKQIARNILNTYHADGLVGTEPYTRDQCIEINQLVGQAVQGFYEGVHDYSSSNAKPKKQSVINYASYRRSFTLHKWSDLWDFDLSYGQNVIKLLSGFVALPDSEIQLPIIAAFACQNSALMNLSNTLFLYSRKAGSGKSTVAEVLSALQGNLKADDDDSAGGMAQASSTFASIRNFIQQERVFRYKGQPMVDAVTRQPLEKNLCLVLDDLPEGQLKEDDYYNLLKAYKRQNSIIRKAERRRDEDGNMVDVTISFQVFCNKVLTACYQIFGNPDYQELTRRCIFIKCRPVEEIDSLGNVSQDEIEFYKPSEIDWKGAPEQYYSYWSVDGVLCYQDAIKRLRKPQSVSASRWEISKSLVAAGYSMGVWNSLKEASDAIVAYWDWFTQQAIDTKSPVELVLDSCIAEWIDCCEDETFSGQYLEDGTKNQYYPMSANRIDPAYVDIYLQRAYKKSELDRTPTAKVRDDTMIRLGYKLKRYHGRNFYCSID